MTYKITITPYPQVKWKNTTEEVRITDEIERELEDWRQLNAQWLELTEEFEALDILNPAMLVADLQQFRGDHYALELNVAMLMQAGEQFSGGEDPTACNFGRWLPEFTTENPDIQRLLQQMREPHDRFHQAVGDIRNAVQAGNEETAFELFTTEMMPASDEVFDYFDRLLALADEANALRDEITQLTIGPIHDEAYDVMERIDQLIAINDRISEEAVHQADADGQNVELIALIGMVLGVILALILGVILTRGITAPLAKGERTAGVSPPPTRLYIGILLWSGLQL